MGTAKEDGTVEHRLCYRKSLIDQWPTVPGAGARWPGLPRQRPSAGTGPRRAQRAALITYGQIRQCSAVLALSVLAARWLL